MEPKQEMLLRILTSFIKQGYKLNDRNKRLLIFKMINKKQYYSINKIIEEKYHICDALKYLGYNNSFINYIYFYNNYYPLDLSIEYSLNLVVTINKVKKELLTTLIYPSILITLTMLALLFMSNFIIPQLSMMNPESLTDYNIIISILKYLPRVLLSFFIIIIIFIFSTLLLIKYRANYIFAYYFKLPLISSVFKLIASLLFSLYLKEVITQVNLSKQAILMLDEQTNNIFIKYTCSELLKKLKKGEHIFDVINNNKILSDDLKQSIFLADNSQHLKKLLDDYFMLKINIIQRKIKIFLAIFIPCIVSLVGVLLILMYLMIMMPLINLDYDI